MNAVISDPSHAPWMADGACRDEDPDLFFPIGTGQADAAQTRRARSICHRCDVEAQCLRYALSNRVKHGIWGGHTEQERVTITRARQRRRRRSSRRP
jgi:WhiB family transcriptional regulator, redox-sensing transcriptional regulator